MNALRPYQSQAIAAVRSRLESGVKRLVLVLATGGGKTVVAAHIVASAVARGTHVLFVAHRRELIKQSWTKLVRNGIHPKDIGVIMAAVPTGPLPVALDMSLSDAELWARYARRLPNAQVQVASLDSIRNKAKPVARLVIVDECHRSVSKSYVDLLAYYCNSVVIGLTATPYRADNRGLGEEVTSGDRTWSLFQDLVVVASPRLLIQEGFLVEPRVFTVPAEELPDISRVKIRGGDYDPEQLSAAVDRDPLVGSVITHWEKHARGVRTVVFPVSIAHSHHVVERFVAAGVAAEHLDGSTPTSQRDAILARLERGETLVVSSVGVLCEGWDQPSVKCCALLRPTQSTGLYLQMAGRILRPWHGQRAVILDHSGCTLDHGFVTQDREFSLEARAKKRGISAAPAKTCSACWAVLPATASECECGHKFGGEAGSRGGVPEEAEGELIEVTPPCEEDLREAWDQLCEQCVAKGYKPAWCYAKWAEAYPSTRPPHGCVPPTADACSVHRNKRVDALDGYVRTAILKGWKVGAAKGSFKASQGEWPSLELFKQTGVADEVAGVVEMLMGLARWVVVEKVGVVNAKPLLVAPSNDVELVDYAV